jgi:hypothetical protein
MLFWTRQDAVGSFPVALLSPYCESTRGCLSLSLSLSLSVHASPAGKGQRRRLGGASYKVVRPEVMWSSLRRALKIGSRVKENVHANILCTLSDMFPNSWPIEIYRQCSRIVMEFCTSAMSCSVAGAWYSMVIESGWIPQYYTGASGHFVRMHLDVCSPVPEWPVMYCLFY